MSSQVIGVLLTFAIVAISAEPCQTPNRQAGDCKPITECQQLLSILEKSLPTKAGYLRKHHCGFFKQIPKVCCPHPNKLLSEENCGMHTQRKIVGGNKTQLDDFPWLALLEYKNSNGSIYFDCGGVLINNRYILTAAHCIKNNLNSVRLGEYNTKEEIDCIRTTIISECAPKPVIIPIEEKIAHEGYKSDDLNQYHDIALLRLKKEVTFSDFIKPICLPTKREELLGKELYVAGWGITENRTTSDTKLEVQIPVQDKSSCETTFRNFNYNLTLKDSQLCVGGEKGKDSCKGDSGGPLMNVKLNKNKDLVWYAEGIVSFGATPCGMKNWPGIYTRTSEYIDWIDSKMRP